MIAVGKLASGAGAVACRSAASAGADGGAGIGPGGYSTLED